VIQNIPQPPDTKDVEVHFKISTDPLAQGQVLEQAGKWKDAIELYVAAIKEKPTDGMLWKALGNDYYQLGKKDYAIRCFERVLQLEPDNQALKDWLAKYKAGTGTH
jgi:tetratricopeptide (TPR) repeat protein